mmetsp:Transcript_10058/g.25177  ORF Transcript_10058/g.25177 Transcript_10058/m.25177 type:complete len:557 (-) Transcript_10058:37-1707(-)
MSLCWEESESSGDEIEDDDADHLSYVGEAAYELLRKKHNRYWHDCWNVTSGSVVGELHQTPRSYGWNRKGDPMDGHDDWFPAKMCEIMSRTQYWCDVCSLGPPDGLFMEKFKEALGNIAKTAADKDNDKPIIIRMMFGNIVGMPVNCDAVIHELTADLDEDANIQLWVGAWRKGVSWNHAKIIAVDGRYLHTGGHNVWDRHYLKSDPVHDLSMELEGRVTHDGHLFANKQWEFVEDQQSGIVGRAVSQLPDNVPTPLQIRVTVSEWPEGEAEEFPPIYRKSRVPHVGPVYGHVPIITMGRYGALLRSSRPSDDAIVAMLDSAETIIHMALQDLGPITLPGLPGPIAVPGCVWPKAYLEALGRGIWEKEIDVEIIVSNPGSIPDNLSPTEALYGNGWTCATVAAQIIKTIKDQFEEVDDEELRDKVRENLRVCYLRQRLGNEWSDGKTLGMHAKHFIIDDIAYYVGSQNLYIADLAEWGVLIDSPEYTLKAKQEYWDPLWRDSYTEEDCDVDDVMDGLDIDRNGSTAWYHDEETRALMEQAQRSATCVPADNSGMYD